jgi:hypothetical protein
LLTPTHYPPGFESMSERIPRRLLQGSSMHLEDVRVKAVNPGVDARGKPIPAPMMMDLSTIK